jgi:hypothetical protein
VRFTIEQRFTARPDEVARTFTEPRLYEAFQDLPKLSRPDVLAHEVDGDVVRLQVRYRFSGELSAAARAVLDPARLTWVEHSTHDLSDRSTTFTMVPDHYGDRFRCSGRYQFEPDGDGTVRRGEGEVKVKALLVAGAVESAIVSGLREHLADEVDVVNDLLSG